MKIKQKIQERRQVRQFQRALDSMSPAARNELVAIALHQNAFSRR